MADRTIKVTLAAQVNGYLAGMEAARQATQKSATEAEKAAEKFRVQNEMMDKAGKVFMIAGAATLAATALAVKAAMDWESAWTGVLKTVDGTPEQLAAVEDGLRSLARQLPSTHEEIAAVAEAAGQLGIQTGNIQSFTRTMIDLGVATNLSAEDAATSIARFTNIMGTSQGEVSNLGAALVGLGNNYATTEREIMEMSMRLAGAGVQIGLSEGEVLGLATALSSVGIEAEAGGSAMSKVMIDIAASVEEGGAKLESFARISGLSATDFSTKWKTDAGGALAAFVKGLANAESQGQSTLGMLAELGIKEVRMRDALLRSASAADNFNAAMAQGSEEYKKNTALTDEATKKYETLDSKFKMMNNRVIDASISFGEALTPALKVLADVVGNVADGLGNLPQPLQQTLGIAVPLVGVVALLGGAFLVAIPKVAQFNGALTAMGVTAQVTARGVGLAIGTMTGVFGLAITALSLFGAAQADAREKAKSYGDSLDKTTGKVTTLTRELVAANLAAKESFLWMEEDSVLEAASKLGINLGLVTDAALGNADALKEVNSQLDAIAPGAKGYVEASEASGLSAMDFLGAQKKLKDGIESTNNSIQKGAADNKLLAEANGDSADAAGVNTDALDGLGGSAQEAALDVDALTDAILGFGKSEIDARGAARSLEAAYDDLAASIATNGVTLDITTAQGRANEAALDGVANAAKKSASATLENTNSQEAANAVISTGRDRLIAMLGQLNITGQSAQDYANKLGLIPTEVKTTVKADTAPAEGSIERFVQSASGRVIVIRTRVDQDAAYLGQTGLGGPGGGLANGGIVSYYANGGFHRNGFQENHIAQIAPAGAYRVWAEEETGGEAYIPLALSKRARSLEIWKQTGTHLGVTGFAGGGVVDPVRGYAQDYRPQYAPQVAVSVPEIVVSPQFAFAGGTVKLSVGGRTFDAYMEGKIEAFDNESAHSAGLGWRG